LSNPSLRLGYTITSFTTGNDDPWAGLLLQSDGKIVVTGARGDRHLVAVRYSPDGVLDATFGNGGIADLGDSGTRSVAALQADGKILVVDGPNSVVRVTRLNINGSFDATFGSGGRITFNASGSKRGLTVGWAVATQRVPATTGEERIVVAGYSGDGGNGGSLWTVMRFRSNGATDTNFSTNGVVTTTFSGLGDRALGVKIDSSNRIVTAGLISLNGPCGTYVADYAVVRYTQDGQIDGSFGGGKQIIDVYGGRDDNTSLALQVDGKVLIYGSAASSDDSENQIALVRLNTDGSRDASFGLQGNGVVTLDGYGSGTHAYANLAVSPVDGKIVVAGATNLATPSPFSIFVARYLP